MIVDASAIVAIMAEGPAGLGLTERPDRAATRLTHPISVYTGDDFALTDLARPPERHRSAGATALRRSGSASGGLPARADDLLDRLRAPEEPALSLLGPERHDLAALGLVLNPLDHHPHAELASELADHLDDGAR